MLSIEKYPLPDKIEMTFKVNVISYFWTIKSFMREMIERKKGHIVTVASSGGYVPTDKLSDYCASKAAAVSLHDGLRWVGQINTFINQQSFYQNLYYLRVELGLDNLLKYVKMTLVNPYFTATGLFAGVKSSQIPIQTPDHVADNVVRGILTNQGQKKKSFSINLTQQNLISLNLDLVLR